MINNLCNLITTSLVATFANGGNHLFLVGKHYTDK